MLLETLDVRKKDVLIYSQNKFDFSDNFRIIFKSNKVKRPQKISYFDVCEFVKDPNPKNLIVYRLLTNVTNLDAYSTKYGYFIKVNGRSELIYFDPVFAIKDIRHLRFDFEPEQFRFKIQQVGLTSRRMQIIEADYEEVFGFDLKAIEAQHQNDKIFADAIYAFDETYMEEDEAPKVSRPARKNYSGDLEDDFAGGFLNDLGNISEVKKSAGDDLSKLHFEQEEKTSNVRDAKVNILKKALGIEEQPKNFKNMIEDEAEKDLEEGDMSLFDLFKSTSKFSDLDSRKNESFILKLNSDIK